MLERLELFYGESSNVRTRVYATAPRPDDASAWQLRGLLQGPFRQGSYTLPASFIFRDLGPGDTLLCQADVIDPCPWSPTTPSIYRAAIEIYQGEQKMGSVRREIGLRTLGAKAQSLYWEGRRWVLRGVRTPAADPEELDALQEAGGVCAAASPSDAFCRLATEQGVGLLAMLDGAEQDWFANAQRLARHPAVCFLALRNFQQIKENPLKAAPNPLWLAQIDPEKPAPPPAWAASLLIETTALDAFAAYAATTKLPIVALGSDQGPANGGAILERRQGCDRLQRELKPFGDFAGFVV